MHDAKNADVALSSRGLVVARKREDIYEIYLYGRNKKDIKVSMKMWNVESKSHRKPHRVEHVSTMM